MKRVAYSSVGAACVGLGALGVLLPGLPTTPFLLLAVYMFARGHPEWGERLLSHRIFRPYRPFIEGSEPIPARIRWTAIAVVWIVVGTSAALLLAGEEPNPYLVAGLVAAALLGTAVILRFRRRPARAETGAGPDPTTARQSGSTESTRRR